MIRDYGNNADAFQENAADWFDEKIAEGRVLAALHRRGNSRQGIVTPGLLKVPNAAYYYSGSSIKNYYIYYEIIIKKDRGVEKAVFKLTCRQTPDMPEKVRKYYVNHLLNNMGKAYNPTQEWFSKRFNSMTLTADTKNTDIYAFLEAGLKEAEAFEKLMFIPED